VHAACGMWLVTAVCELLAEALCEWSGMGYDRVWDVCDCVWVWDVCDRVWHDRVWDVCVQQAAMCIRLTKAVSIGLAMPVFVVWGGWGALCLWLGGAVCVAGQSCVCVLPKRCVCVWQCACGCLGLCV